MTEQQFKQRTRQFALDVIRQVDQLPRTRTASVIGYQLVRSATSVGANYRAACRGRSARDMVAKLALVEEEADESLYWMELLIAAHLVTAHDLQALTQEADEILAMTVSSIKTLRKRLTVP